MVEIPAGLIWLASYPKSGNTWMRILLANLLSGTAQPVDINKLSEPETLIGRWRFADDMLVDADLLSEAELAVMRPMQCDFVARTCNTPFFARRTTVSGLRQDARHSARWRERRFTSYATPAMSPSL